MNDPYLSYGAYSDPGYLIYLILLIPVLLLSAWAQWKVSHNFNHYSHVGNSRHLTGAAAAEMILRAYGVRGVSIAACRGQLSDHYDPRNNTIYLSESVYHATSVAAVGVAAHEAGHAVQYAVGYAPIKIRNFVIPMTQIGSKFSFMLLLLGMILYSQELFFIGIVLFSFTTLFQLITLPVEFNASRRALETLEGKNILDGEELDGARKVLSAAALTYVAALLMSFVQLLRYVFIFVGRSSNGRRGGESR